MQLSLLHLTTDSSMTSLPEWMIPEDVENLQHTEHDRTVQNRLRVLGVLPHEHSV